MAGNMDAMMQNMMLAFLPQLMMQLTGKPFQPMARNPLAMFDKMRRQQDLSQSQNDGLAQDVEALYRAANGGKAMTPAEIQAAVGSLKGIMPIANMFGGDMFARGMDMITPGGSGFAAAKAIDSMHGGMMDPFTGRQGLNASMRNALLRSNEALIGGNPMAQGGLRRGELGQIAAGLQTRGLTGRSLGTMSEDQKRLATGSTEEQWKGMDDTAKENALTEAEAKRISGKVKNAGEAIRSMQTLFEEDGHTGASIPELMEALENLGASLGKMDARQSAVVAREIVEAGRKIGLDAKQTSEIYAQTAALGKQLGLTDTQTRSLFTGTAATSYAMKQMGMFDNKGPGALNADEAVQAVQQRQVSGAKSEFAFRLAAIHRAVANEEMGADSELGKIAAKAKRGEKLNDREEQLLRSTPAEFEAAFVRGGAAQGSLDLYRQQMNPTMNYASEGDAGATAQAQVNETAEKAGRMRVGGLEGDQAAVAAFQTSVVQAFRREFATSGNAKEAQRKVAAMIPDLAKKAGIKVPKGSHFSLVDKIVEQAGGVGEAFGMDTGVKNATQDAQVSGAVDKGVAEQRENAKQAAATQRILEANKENVRNGNVAAVIADALKPENADKSVLGYVMNAFGYEETGDTTGLRGQIGKQKVELSKKQIALLKKKNAGGLNAEEEKELEEVTGQVEQLNKFEKDNKERLTTPVENKAIDKNEKEKTAKEKEEAQKTASRPIEIKVAQFKLTGGRIEITKDSKVEATLETSADSVPVRMESDRKTDIV